jgi:hypothetical protein
MENHGLVTKNDKFCADILTGITPNNIEYPMIFSAHQPKSATYFGYF